MSITSSVPAASPLGADTSGDQNMSSLRKHVLPLLLLVFGVLAIYSNSLNGDFQFDDQQITDRPNLHITALSLDSMKGTFYWTPNRNRIYRPLPCLSLGINYYFGGIDTFGYHLVNVGIHILCSLAVYLFLHALLSVPGVRPTFAVRYRYEIAVIGTFLFAFHPIQTNVATYVIQRMTSMSALFYILSVTGYIWFRRRTLPNQNGSPLRKYASFSFAVVSAICAFLSKENSAFLPVMTLLIDYLFFYHLYEEGTRKKLRRIYAISVFSLLGLLAYGGTTPILTYVTGYGHRDFSCVERLLTESRVIFFYLYLLVVPSVGILNLNHDFSISRGLMEPPQTCLALAVIALLLVIAFAIRKKHNLLSFVVVWYLGNLVIESTILPLEIIYEHRIYLPGVLVFFLMSLAIVYFCKRIVRKKKAIVFVSLLLILYGNGTYLRNFVYGDTLSLWLDVTDKSPNMARAHANLGKVYMDLGHHLEAKEAIEKALELTPDMPEALVNLGQLYIEHFGMVEEGIALIKKSQRLNPKYALGFMSLGEAFFKTKDYGKAEHYYGAVVKRLNFYLPAINNLGIARIHLGKTDQAIKTFEYGIRLDPTYESFHLNLAKLYSNKERFSDAIETLNRYLQMNENSRNGRVLLERIKQKASAANLAKNEIRTSQIVEE